MDLLHQKQSPDGVRKYRSRKRFAADEKGEIIEKLITSRGQVVLHPCY